MYNFFDKLFYYIKLIVMFPYLVFLLISFFIYYKKQKKNVDNPLDLINKGLYYDFCRDNYEQLEELKPHLIFGFWFLVICLKLM